MDKRKNKNRNNNNNEKVQSTADKLLYGAAPDYRYKSKYEYDDERFENFVYNKQTKPMDPHCNYSLMISGRRVLSSRRRFRITVENQKQLEKARGMMMTKEGRFFEFSETLNIIIGLGLDQFFQKNR